MLKKPTPPPQSKLRKQTQTTLLFFNARLSRLTPFTCIYGGVPSSCRILFNIYAIDIQEILCLLKNFHKIPF